ncbi:PadR family transcriptional regulator [Plantactinospora endophytica]|uniref:PadR family transcriptional regulator n=1 Tax=Plantactinospora endophytica TaxID=673535 RepID=A0ABQ4E779_9ACTN|nr:PadR family transcriptional regulator [Plantactinospora endophytica]GIG90546.1 PadR family transcriptional regulator [Plantactinospora endophytica]
MEISEQTFLILSALADQPRHGYALVTEVAQMTDGRIRLRAGTLYGALDRLVTQGLIAPDHDEVENGRLRRFYRLTDTGADAIRAESRRMASAIRLAEERLNKRAGHNAPRLGTSG